LGAVKLSQLNYFGIPGRSYRSTGTVNLWQLGCMDDLIKEYEEAIQKFTTLIEEAEAMLPTLEAGYGKEQCQEAIKLLRKGLAVLVGTTAH
jgi:hypothetical protein